MRQEHTTESDKTTLRVEGRCCFNGVVDGSRLEGAIVSKCVFANLHPRTNLHASDMTEGCRITETPKCQTLAC